MNPCWVDHRDASSPNVEVAKLATGNFLDNFKTVYFVTHRSAHTVNESFQNARFAFRHQFHSAIGQVANVSRHFKTLGHAACGVPEADALHSATETNDPPNLLHTTRKLGWLLAMCNRPHLIRLSRLSPRVFQFSRIIESGAAQARIRHSGTRPHPSFRRTPESRIRSAGFTRLLTEPRPSGSGNHVSLGGPRPTAPRLPVSVIPANAGIQKNAVWTPACAGVTIGTIPLVLQRQET